MASGWRCAILAVVILTVEFFSWAYSTGEPRFSSYCEALYVKYGPTYQANDTGNSEWTAHKCTAAKWAAKYPDLWLED